MGGTQMVSAVVGTDAMPSRTPTDNLPISNLKSQNPSSKEIPNSNPGRDGGAALDTARIYCDWGAAVRAPSLYRQRHHSIKRRRSLSMALVETTGAVLLQQTAADYLHAVPGDVALWRYGFWCTFLFTRHRRDSERPGASVLFSRGQCARRIFFAADHDGDAVDVSRRGADDGGPAFGVVLDGGDAGGLAGGAEGRWNRALALGGTLDGAGIVEQIYGIV